MVLMLWLIGVVHTNTHTHTLTTGYTMLLSLEEEMMYSAETGRFLDDDRNKG